ncbi:hypothetical protein NDU88_007430 [Pleurodeles waltl]|uniref:Uncharacterized protein n=1 Tax=Pleurodeles waltl TaxID=8319 RepID=A0AAV7WHM7_PLEWA|nr:hypothetical protein NDU88_007430 [Pleurodeles waltl]
MQGLHQRPHPGVRIGCSVDPAAQGHPPHLLGVGHSHQVRRGPGDLLEIPAFGSCTACLWDPDLCAHLLFVWAIPGIRTLVDKCSGASTGVTVPYVSGTPVSLCLLLGAGAPLILYLPWSRCTLQTLGEAQACYGTGAWGVTDGTRI